MHSVVWQQTPLTGVQYPIGDGVQHGRGWGGGKARYDCTRWQRVRNKLSSLHREKNRLCKGRNTTEEDRRVRTPLSDTPDIGELSPGGA